ncbi:SDR family NAD(P)-dependent oxidoreductase [Nostoc sp. NMS4]|uniref:SDR family NAD(P)-dependent oxidoreductase n=1 Tax=Nostoc sp. NMS4 TaxID=2815390 RepID=UPI0025D04DA6|nr:SDR family NAD(P)-dependent oxidoreductase [Nostoc sp. NMS4]MBN3927937.1 SDR family NAD(P)-dependent oxidoreductase [Nostoc sp. NMS4]
MSQQHICLLTVDGSPISIKLAQSLAAQGWKVVLLSFPESIISDRFPLPTGMNHVKLSDMSEEHLQQQLKAIAQNYGSIGAFIHLSPLTATASTAKAILKQVFLIAKHLKKPLNEAAKQGRSWFVTVSRLDGNLGIGKSSDFSPIHGGLFGLTKTLNLEWEKVFCRAVDISPEINSESAVESILAELYDPNRLFLEIGYNSQGRNTIVNENNPISSNSKIKNHISQDSVFLVSGGGRGITAECVIKLAQVFRCKFILLGRSAMSPEPSYAKGCSDEIELKKRIIQDIYDRGEKPTPIKVNSLLKSIIHGREIQETISKIEQLGSKVEYISADITTGAIVQQKVAEITAKFGRITGVIHGAGNLADKLIEHKTAQDFEAVYVPKILGLETLLSCVEMNQLDHLVVFSSAAGFYGNIGQSDYAIANEIINKFAHQFRHQYPNCHVISFNWGPWDGGMVTPEVKQIFAQRNIEVIPVEVGTQMLVEELAFGDRNQVQVLVGGSLATLSSSLEPEIQTYRVRRKLTLEANPFLQDHVIGEHSVLPVTYSIAWMANTCEQLYPGYKFFSFSKYKVLKGIVFDESLANEYIVDLKEINKSPDNEIELDVTIWSKTKTGMPRYHYNGQVKLVRQIRNADIYKAFDKTEDENCVGISPYKDGTLFHGSSFQGVKRVLNISSTKLTFECVNSITDVEQYGQFSVQTFNPCTADIQNQGMLIWVRHFYQAACLPFKFEKGEHFQDIPSAKKFYISIEVLSSNSTNLKANIISHDIDGQVYSQVFDGEVIINKQLNSLFIPAEDREMNKISRNKRR